MAGRLDPQGDEAIVRVCRRLAVVGGEGLRRDLMRRSLATFTAGKLESDVRACGEPRHVSRRHLHDDKPLIFVEDLVQAVSKVGEGRHCLVDQLLDSENLVDRRENAVESRIQPGCPVRGRRISQKAGQLSKPISGLGDPLAPWPSTR